MNWVGILLVIIHIFTCVGVILVVLLQAGKGASLGAAFGGGASQTLFGAQSANFITKATWVMAASFMVTSLLLTLISPWGSTGAQSESTVLQGEAVPLPPLGKEMLPMQPEESPAPAGLPGAIGQPQDDQTVTQTSETPATTETSIESPLQPESETPATVPETPATVPDPHPEQQ
jgi:preprotein translocase subunit SecG